MSSQFRKQLRQSKYHGVVREASETPEPQVRCWQHENGSFHLACSRAGGQQLVSVVERLQNAAKTRAIVVPLIATPLPAGVNPVGAHEVRRTLSTLRLELIDDPARAPSYSISASGAATLEVLLGIDGLGKFLLWTEELADGNLYDFCIALGGIGKARVRGRRNDRLCFWSDTYA